MKTISESLASDGWQVVSVHDDVVELIRPWPPQPGIHHSWMKVQIGMEDYMAEGMKRAAELLGIDEPVIVEKPV